MSIYLHLQGKLGFSGKQEEKNEGFQALKLSFQWFVFYSVCECVPTRSLNCIGYLAIWERALVFHCICYFVTLGAHRRAGLDEERCQIFRMWLLSHRVLASLPERKGLNSDDVFWDLLVNTDILPLFSCSWYVLFPNKGFDSISTAGFMRRH